MCSTWVAMYTVFSSVRCKYINHLVGKKNNVTINLGLLNASYILSFIVSHLQFVVKQLLLQISKAKLSDLK